MIRVQVGASRRVVACGVCRVVTEDGSRRRSSADLVRMGILSVVKEVEEREEEEEEEEKSFAGVPLAFIQSQG